MKHDILERFLERYKTNKSIQNIRKSIVHLQPDDIKLENIFPEAISCIEDCIWENSITDTILSDYHKLYHEYETLIKTNNKIDNRHKFIIAIPVADRPEHLKSCLQSILTLCETFQYGGKTQGVYTKLCILVCDDSQHQTSKNKHKETLESFILAGLDIIYFGEEQQKDILSHINLQKSKNITGQSDPENFYHKGASITRNITYLKLKEFSNTDEPVIFYFIDSDQKFQINIKTPNGSKELYAINYFYHLNKIFSNTNTSILTGKVVGDPPVSPAVMAGTFIDDIINFTQNISTLSPEQTCQFHNQNIINTDDAAYHDMAELFGFKSASNVFDYHCSLEHEHNHIACLNSFSTKLNHFFDGEHPTRQTYYEYENISKSIKPARTIYTGNYIFKPENLKYFIPFANLKLRMAGPVLGRIIQSELGDAFSSANLPMLHKRTIDSTGQAEFRAGVNHKDKSVNLSNEFIRQFFGDVMLFSIIELTKMGYPSTKLAQKVALETIEKTFLSMKSKYILKKQELSKKVIKLRRILNSSDNWWNINSESSSTLINFSNFIDNIELNFGEQAFIYQSINNQKNVDAYLEQILTAINAYYSDRSYWQSLLSDEAATS